MKGKSLKQKKEPAPGVVKEGLPRFEGNTLKLHSPEEWAVLSGALQASTLGVAADHMTKAVAAKPRPTDEQKNAALELITDLAPQSPTEVMLVGQMIQVNDAAAKCMSIFANVDAPTDTRAQFANLAMKFQRTFCQQIEALQKLRGQGGQRVHVEHVHVHQGGQAVVGNVQHGGGGGHE